MPRRQLAAILFVLAAFSSPLPARAQAAARLCTDCMVGVYDDAALTRTTGTMSAFQIKSVYLGMRLPAGMTVSTLSFDALYPAGFTVLDVSSYVADALYVPRGDGVKVDWPHCISGARALFRVQVFSFGAVRDAALQLRNAEIGACADPRNDRWRVPTSCYVLNPSGRPTACWVAIEPATWTAMKGLFK